MMEIHFNKLQMLDFMSNEAYNILRSNLTFCGEEYKVICVTSCYPGEGKSLVSLRLGITLAESGKKVLFLDANLRNSILLEKLKASSIKFGLVHYLSGIHELSEILYHTNIDNLDWIPQGIIPPNPADLLSSSRFQELIEELRKSYQYIIVDTPPVGLVIDGVHVAKYSDGILFVMESGKVGYSNARKVIHQLKKSDCKILGIALNRVPIKRRITYGKY